jgi:2-iminobutanoate/2-iminopropanoate deaminase
MTRLFLLFAALGLPLLAQRQYVHMAENPNRVFSDAVQVGDTLYVAGRLGLEADGKVPADFASEVRNCLNSIGAVLKKAGYDFSDVVKVTAFLTDLQKFEEWNKVYREFFKGQELPARATVGVAGLVRGGRVEVEVTAVKRARGARFINTPQHPQGLPFSDAVEAGGVLYVAGAIGTGPDGAVPKDFAQEVRYMLENQTRVLKAAGYGLEDVVRVTAYLTDLTRFEEWNKVYREFFKGGRLPARATVGVASLVLGARVEAEMIATKGR